MRKQQPFAKLKVPRESRVHERYLRHSKRFPNVWCAGCGIGIVLGAIIRAVDGLQLDKNDVALLSGIGCTGRMSVYVDFNTMHTAHGRALAFATGLKMVLVLILPAVAGLFALSEPVVTLVFQHGDFTAFDTEQTATALRIYLLGTTFAAIDLPLIYAFYARKDTLTPALVGVLAVGLYLTAALLPAIVRGLRMTDLVLANSVQLTGHALVMIWLINRVAPLRGRGLGPTTLKAVAASFVMGTGLWGALSLLVNWLPAEGLIPEIALVSILSLFGGGIYLLALILLKAQELEPDNLDYLYALADFHLKRRNLKKAKSIAKEMVARHPNQRIGHDILGLIEKNLGANSN